MVTVDGKEDNARENWIRTVALDGASMFQVNALTGVDPEFEEGVTIKFRLLRL